MHHILLMLQALGWWDGAAGDGGGPVEPDPVTPSGGTGQRRRRFAALMSGGR